MDNSGNFVVSWNSLSQDGSSWGIYAQRFAADGTPLGGEFLVNTYTNADQYRSAVTLDQSTGNYLIAWESNQDGSGMGHLCPALRGRRHAARRRIPRQ